jgi:hypothetical protein
MTKKEHVSQTEISGSTVEAATVSSPER